MAGEDRGAFVKAEITSDGRACVGRETWTAERQAYPEAQDYCGGIILGTELV